MVQWIWKYGELLPSYNMEIPGGNEAGAVYNRFLVVQPSDADPTSTKTEEIIITMALKFWDIQKLFDGWLPVDFMFL